jgi:lysozyme family protein
MAPTVWGLFSLDNNKEKPWAFGPGGFLRGGFVDNQNFKKSLAFTLKWEGGYSDDKDDKGGETKFGISKKSHPGLDIKAINKQRATEIYWKDYWLGSEAHKLEWPLCAAVFDAAVLHGGPRADDMYRTSIKIDIKLSNKDRALKICDLRENLMHRLVDKNPKNKKWIKGWVNRVNDLRALIKKEGNAEVASKSKTKAKEA